MLSFFSELWVKQRKVEQGIKIYLNFQINTNTENLYGTGLIIILFKKKKEE